MSKSTEMVSETGAWFKWAWTYGSLTVEEYDSFDDAVEAAAAASNHGDESLECIEGPMGRVDSDIVQRAIAVIDDRDSAVFWAAPLPVAAIWVKGPGDLQEARYQSYASREEAEADAVSLRERLGDRVRVADLKR